MSNRVTNRVEAHVVTGMISQSCEEAAKIQRQNELLQEKMADEAANRLLDLIVGSAITEENTQEIDQVVATAEDILIPQTEESEATALKNPLMEYMSQYAVAEIEKRLVDELVEKAVEQHLLLEHAFETVLKSLLRDPSPKRT